MSEKPGYKCDDDAFISPEKALVSYLEANPHVVSEIARDVAGYFSGDGQEAIREILEKGYENYLYESDLIDLAEYLEADAITPCIKIGAEWIQPLEERFCGIPSLPVTDHSLATDFGLFLLWGCLNLIEEKGKSNPTSFFVDVFSQKVSECYRRILAEKQQKRKEERASEDTERRQTREEEDSTLGRVFGSRERIPHETWSDDYCALRRIKDAVSREITKLLGEMWEVSGGEVRGLAAGTDVRTELYQLWQMGEALNGGLQLLAVEGTLWQVHQDADNVTGSSHLSYWSRRTGFSQYNWDAVAGLLQRQRQKEDSILEGKRAKEDEDASELHEGILSHAINDAVPLIGEWMEETIKAQGESLVRDALRLL